MAIDDLKWYTDHHILPICDTKWRPRFEGACNFLFGDASKVLSNWNLRRFTKDFILENFTCVVVSDRDTQFMARYVSHKTDLDAAHSKIKIKFKYELSYETLGVAFYRDRLIVLKLLDEGRKEKMWRRINILIKDVIDARGTLGFSIDLVLEW